MICQISFSKFLNVLHTNTSRAIGNIWSICLGVDIFSSVQSETLAMQTAQAKCEGHSVPSVGAIGNISHLKASRTLPLPSKSSYNLSKVFIFPVFFSKSFLVLHFF